MLKFLCWESCGQKHFLCRRETYFADISVRCYDPFQGKQVEPKLERLCLFTFSKALKYVLQANWLWFMHMFYLAKILHGENRTMELSSL